VLACENATLSQAGRFGVEAAQKQLVKVAKTQGGSSPLKTSALKLPIASTPQPPSAKKGTYTASSSDQQSTDQPVDDKKKGADDKEVLVDRNNPDKKLWISTSLDPK
jgi:myo-inositol-hexaphosphate 3-phosphohydrolase